MELMITAMLHKTDDSPWTPEELDPVKAIRMKEGQAFVVDDLCINCGTCIRECPQGAKTFRQDLAPAGQRCRLFSFGGLR